PERAAEIEIALGRDVSGLERDIERGCHRLERHPSTGNQRLEQHVARAQLHPGTAGGRVQSRDRQRAPGLDLAGDVAVVERPLGVERDVGGLGIALVAVLERRLHGAQRGGVHSDTPDNDCPAPHIAALPPHHQRPPPWVALTSPASVMTARSSERSSAESTRRLTKSKAADWRSRGRGRSQAISSYTRPGCARITMMRSASTIASPTSCVTMTSVGLRSPPTPSQ